MLGPSAASAADLVGVLKYERDDARDVLERASARETAMRRRMDWFVEGIVGQPR